MKLPAQQTQNSQSRDFRIDFLRFIGLVCVILAHTGPPNFIMQLRTFDVPLLVIVSGVALTLSTFKISYLNYYLKRIPRLIAPTWVFLCLFFLFFYLIELISNNEKYPFDLKVICESYLFIFGIGYLWIVRVFLLIALAAPFIHRMNGKIDSDWVYFCYIFLCYAVYELICDSPIGKTNSILINEYILYLIPYTCLFAIGVRLPKISKQRIFTMVVFLSALIIFVLFIFYDRPFEFNKNKYPPRKEYLWYGLTISFILYYWVVLKMNKVKFEKENRFRLFFVFVSSSSMWIYLWHILFMKCLRMYPSIFLAIEDYFYFKFFFFFFSAVILTYLQQILVKKILSQFVNNIRLNNYCKIVFLN